MIETVSVSRPGVSVRTIVLVTLIVLLAVVCGILNPILGFAAVVGLVTAAAIFWKPVIGLWLLIVSVPYQSLRTFHIGPFPVSVTELLFIVTTLAWLFHVVIRRQQRFQPMPLLPTFLVFLVGIVASFLSIITAPPGQSSFAWGVKELVKWLELVVTYVLATNIFRTRREILIGVAILVGSTFSEMLIGIYQFVRRVGPPSFLIHGQFMRAYGTFAQPNPFAGYLNFAVILTLALTVVYWQRPLGKLLGFIGLALIGGVLISLSRSAWLALLIASAVVFDRGGRRTQALLLLGILIVALIAWFYVLGILPASLTSRFTAAFDIRNVNVLHPTPATFSVAQRLAFWIAGARMFASHWLLGVGMGNFGFAYPHYALPGWQQNLEHAHDYYLNQAVETGVLGLGTYLLWLMKAFQLAWHVSSATRDVVLRAVAIGILGMLVTLSVHNALDDLYVHGTVVQIAIMLAWLSVIAQLDRKESEALDVHRVVARVPARTVLGSFQ